MGLHDLINRLAQAFSFSAPEGGWIQRDNPNATLVPSGALARLMINSPEFQNSPMGRILAEDPQAVPKTIVNVSNFSEMPGASGMSPNTRRFGIGQGATIGYGPEQLAPWESIPYPSPPGNILGHEIGHFFINRNIPSDVLNSQIAVPDPAFKDSPYPVTMTQNTGFPNISDELLADLLGGLSPTREYYYEHKVTPAILKRAQNLIDSAKKKRY